MGNTLIRPSSFSLTQLSRHFSPDLTTCQPTTIHDLPFRTKMDAAIRRLKYRDIEPFLSAEVKSIIPWLHHTDQIWATNILIWTQIHGVPSFMELKRFGFFNSLETFLDQSSILSAWVKRFGVQEDTNKQKYAELNSLSGYMTSDLVDTDWLAELKSLAHGGKPHGLIGSDWKRDFITSNQHIKLPAIHDRRPKFISFQDYVESGQWLTAGSSSIGIVHWEAGEENGTFRARKNMLKYLFTAKELIDLVLSWDGVSRNKAFTKDELGKRRLAVASNIEGYLCESYFLALYGHPYKNWKYVTLDETPGQSHNRTSDISNHLKNGAYALPFDFKNFDHQPSQWEISYMVQSNLDEISVPCGHRLQWDIIKQKILKSYAHGQITMKIGNGTATETITGGLPSGVRMTSLIGNQWNAIVTNLVLTYTQEITDSVPLAVGVRGDDTYIVHESPIYLAIVREVYKSVNAIGIDAKFGICHGVCEFLRNEISPTGQRGWTNRSIPSVTQRKPWNPAPWGISNQVTTTKDNIATIERRSCIPATFLHQANKTKWSKYFKQTYKWLELPIREGGLGVYPDNGWRPGRKLSLTKSKSVVFQNIIPSQPSWITLDDDSARCYSNIQMNSLLATDDIAHVSKYTNLGLLAEVRRFKTTWSKTSLDGLWLDGIITPQPLSHVYWKRYSRSTDETWEGHTFMEVVASASAVARALDTTVKELIAPRFPRTWERIKQLEKDGWHRTDAINIVTGNFPTASTFHIHPSLTLFISNAVGRHMRNKKGRIKIARTLYAYTWSGERQMIEQHALRTYAY